MNHGHCLFQDLNVHKLHIPAFSHDTLQCWVGCKPPLCEVRGQVMEVAKPAVGKCPLATFS